MGFKAAAVFCILKEILCPKYEKKKKHATWVCDLTTYQWKKDLEKNILTYIMSGSIDLKHGGIVCLFVCLTETCRS